MMMMSRGILITISIVILASKAQAQLPEVHQAAAVSQFTGIYSFIGSFIAIRELYSLAGLVAVLIAGNVLLTFFQLPSYFLPVYHNQRRFRSRSGTGHELLQLPAFIQNLEDFEEKLREWYQH